MARSQLKELFVETNTEEELEIGVGSESMEAAMLDIQEAYQEVTALEQDQDELEEIAEGLEAIVESMEASMDQGGLDPIAAQFAHHAVNAYTERLGFESEQVLPALEAFGGDSGREASTTVSMEGVGEQLKKIWNAIRAVIEKAIAAVKAFFAKIFGGIGKFESRIDSLKKDLNEKKSWTVKKETKFSPPSPNVLMYNGKADIKSVDDGITNLNLAIEDMYNVGLKGASEYYAKVGTIFGDKSADDEKAANAKLMELGEKQAIILKLGSKIQNTRFSGDKALVMNVKGGSENEDSKATNAPSFSISSAAGGGKAYSGGSEIAVPSISELTGFVNQLETFVSSIKKKKSEIEKIETARKAAMDAGKKLVEESDRGRVGKMWATAKGRSLLNSAKADYVRPITLLTGYGFGVVRAGIGYAESALGKYEKPKSTTP